MGVMNVKGAGFALMAAALFGASTPLAKLVIGDVGPLMVAGLLYLGAGVGLAAYRVFAMQATTEAKLSRSDMPWLIGAIVFGGLLGPALLMVGLASTSAGTASLLLTLEGVATALIAFVVFREHIGLRNAAGFAFIVLGGVMLAWRGGVEAPDVLGPALIVGACVAWAVDNNLTRQVSGADPTAIAMWKGLVAGPVNIALALVAGDTIPAMPLTLAAMTIGVAGIGASLVLFILAMRDLGVARSGAYFGLAPFVGAAIAVPMFGETVGLPFILAGVLIGLGVFIHLTENHDHEHVHERMSHDHVHVHDTHHQHAHDPDDPNGEPHAHAHVHPPMRHSHAHTPDDHHRHKHRDLAT
jgi:drug/metabolite transporter (DMT)-like permease